MDWNGENYCGLTLNWHHEKGYIYISMPGYVKKTLQWLQQPYPTSPQYALHRCTEPSYGSKVQMASIDATSKLDKN